MAEVALQDVNKNFEEVYAVRNVNLSIHDNEFMVLVGPSGCGKTTTLRMVAGLELISSGRILIDDKIVNELPPMDRDIAMVFQNYALYPHMSVYDNMAFGLKMRKFDRADIQEAGAGGGRNPRDPAIAEPQAPAIVGRPAPARRLGPRHRAPPPRLPVRRAAFEPRRQIARADPRRTQEAAQPARHHRDLCDPRPGRGDDPGRPRRRHEGRAGAAGRRAARTLQRARQPLCRGLYRLAGDEFPVRAGRRERWRRVGRE